MIPFFYYCNKKLSKIEMRRVSNYNLEKRISHFETIKRHIIVTEAFRQYSNSTSSRRRIAGPSPQIILWGTLISVMEDVARVLKGKHRSIILDDDGITGDILSPKNINDHDIRFIISFILTFSRVTIYIYYFT